MQRLQALLHRLKKVFPSVMPTWFQPHHPNISLWELSDRYHEASSEQLFCSLRSSVFSSLVSHLYSCFWMSTVVLIHGRSTRVQLRFKLFYSLNTAAYNVSMNRFTSTPNTNQLSKNTLLLLPRTVR